MAWHRDDSGMIRAAGGVLWRSAEGGTVEVALVHRPEYPARKGSVWALFFSGGCHLAAADYYPALTSPRP
jgi:hypothetical protein